MTAAAGGVPFALPHSAGPRVSVCTECARLQEAERAAYERGDRSAAARYDSALREHQGRQG
ncbi:hypothetical protein ACFP1Z_20935 [Streptomyces gamaensis]|uniref:Uncharacterized protein n=1 Tax=Streptomyces gamaensis TaxID=1763542 RepID=A0ABW0Z1E7_9ACTN